MESFSLKSFQYPEGWTTRPQTSWSRQRRRLLRRFLLGVDVRLWSTFSKNDEIFIKLGCFRRKQVILKFYENLTAFIISKKFAKNILYSGVQPFSSHGTIT